MQCCARGVSGEEALSEPISPQPPVPRDWSGPATPETRASRSRSTPPKRSSVIAQPRLHPSSSFTDRTATPKPAVLRRSASSLRCDAQYGIHRDRRESTTRDRATLKVAIAVVNTSNRLTRGNGDKEALIDRRHSIWVLAEGTRLAKDSAARTKHLDCVAARKSSYGSLQDVWPTEVSARVSDNSGPLSEPSWSERSSPTVSRSKPRVSTPARAAASATLAPIADAIAEEGRDGSRRESLKPVAPLDPSSLNLNLRSELAISGQLTPGGGGAAVSAAVSAAVGEAVGEAVSEAVGDAVSEAVSEAAAATGRSAQLAAAADGGDDDDGDGDGGVAARDEFCGGWCNIRTDNLEAYLKNLGVSWAKRKIATSFKPQSSWVVVEGVLQVT